MKICELYFEVDCAGILEIEENNDFCLVAHNITVEQAMSIAKMFTKRYDEVRLYDGEMPAYIAFKNRTDKPIVNTNYPEDYNDVAKKFGLYDESLDFDQTDLDKEKWDNYWSDYNQCGVRVDYY